MTSLVLPTFRRSAFCRPPRSLQAPWGLGMPGTYYVLRGDEYDLRLQDGSPATTGRASLKKRARRQRGGIYPGARRFSPSPAEMAEVRRRLRAQFRNQPPTRRQQAASRALVHRPSERLARSTNRALWSVRRRLTPTTLSGKLGTAAALGGAAAAAPIALLSGVLASVMKKKDKG